MTEYALPVSVLDKCLGEKVKAQASKLGITTDAMVTAIIADKYGEHGRMLKYLQQK